MIKTRIALRLVMIVSGVLTLCACAATSPPVEFYTLGAGGPQQQADRAVTVCSSKGIGVGPVNWPRYLEQPRIVTRQGPNKLDFNEFHRWGGSLQDDFEHVMQKSLSVLLHSSKISNYRLARKLRPDYRVEIDVRQFEGRLGGEVVLDASWILLHQESGKVLGLHESRITQQVSGYSYEALVQASSIAVQELGRDASKKLLKICASAG